MRPNGEDDPAAGRPPASNGGNGQEARRADRASEAPTRGAGAVESPRTIDDPGSIAGETEAPAGAARVEPPAERVAAAQKREASTGRHAMLVGTGILLSRLAGLVRQRVFAHYFGTSAAGDAFAAAFRIPNFLQNVFGEGALSASFIPVYSGLLAREDGREAGRVAGAVFTLLALVVSLLVLAGVLSTPLLIDLIAPGFEGEKRELTIRLVKIFFPGAGLLVLSAWCLGILNSHRRFFLSYTAPVLWNLSVIAALVGFGGRLGQFPLAEVAAWGSVAGSALQFGVQLPTVLRLAQNLRPSLGLASESVRTVVRNFAPVFVSRGVVQISAYVDEIIASLLGNGAVVALGYAQLLYTLPVSLFGMSVSAAELPAMSGTLGAGEELYARLRARLDAGLRRIALFIVPSAIGFLALGDVIAGALYQSGRFTRADSLYVWAILAGSAFGLLPSTLGRLYSSTYYALRDTRTPFRFALVRVAVAVLLGYLFALPLSRALGLEPRWGVVGLTFASGLAGWFEFTLLRRTLNRRVGRTGLAANYALKLLSAAAAGAAIAWAVKLSAGAPHPLVVAALTLAPFGLVYFALASALGVQEARALVMRAARPLAGRLR